MNYKEFTAHICHTLRSRLDSDTTITIQDITKNNDTHLDGLTILSGQCNLSPTIYLNPYYAQYQNGRTFDDICQDILTLYNENRPAGSIDISFFTDYDKVKSRIIFKLVNYERNRILLKTVPHFRFLDLAVVFSCLVESGAAGSATILIHNHHLGFWNITKDDLYALAMSNTPELLAYDVKDMSELLTELFGGEILPPFSGNKNTPLPMYVLSNGNRLNGAACMLYRDVLKEFSRRLGSDLTILPSSIHEVLLLPACDSTSHEELTELVRSVNETQLSPQEILSDSVYYFSRKTGEITMEWNE